MLTVLVKHEVEQQYDQLAQITSQSNNRTYNKQLLVNSNHPKSIQLFNNFIKTNHKKLHVTSSYKLQLLILNLHKKLKVSCFILFSINQKQIHISKTQISSSHYQQVIRKSKFCNCT